MKKVEEQTEQKLSKVEEAKLVLQQEEEKRLKEFNEKLNILSKEYGYTLQIQAQIIVQSIKQ